MGLFLQTAVLPGTPEASARAAVEQAAQRSGSAPAFRKIRYVGCGQGTQLFLEDEAPGFTALAKEFSRVLRGPVLLLFIYDGDHWGYDFYQSGQKLDCFDTVPDYDCAITESQRQSKTGKPEVLARYFPVLSRDIQNYFVFWTQEDLDGAGRLAYSGDRFPRGDCWQMTDFLARLGWPWPFDGDTNIQRPVLPTLRTILHQNLPPVVDPLKTQAPYDFQLDDVFAPSSMIFATAHLPSALDPDYILRLLQEEDRPSFKALADKTPQEIIEERARAGEAIKYPSLYHIDPKLAAVSAFCEYWLGHAEEAFWDLYEALYNDPNNIALLRGRSLRVALGIKRHIAIKDLTALLTLDPDNRDVYLLCRAFFCRINRKISQSDSDLNELARTGFPTIQDDRVNYAGFPRSFLTIVDKKRTEQPSGI